MAHTLVRDPHMLGIIFQHCESLRAEDYEMLKCWDLTWPLLKLWHANHITFEGITESGWEDLDGFYEWLINSTDMEPVF